MYEETDDTGSCIFDFLTQAKDANKDTKVAVLIENALSYLDVYGTEMSKLKSRLKEQDKNPISELVNKADDIGFQLKRIHEVLFNHFDKIT